MHRSRFWRNVIAALVILVVVGALGAVKRPVFSGVREYIAYTLTTDYDFTPLLNSLASFSDRVDWSDLLQTTRSTLSAVAPGYRR